MKKRVLSILVALFLASVANAQNLQLAANLSYGNSALSNIGGFVDSLGNEYALVGTDFGLSIVNVTTPSNPSVLYTVPGPTSDWREVKTYRGFAYIATEGGGGLTVVDLRRLPLPVVFQQYTGDGAIAGQLSSIHALHVDTTKGFLYLYGSNIGSGNTLIFDLADPWNPTYAGQYLYPGGGNSSYVHDGYVDNDTLFESHIYSGFFTIVDVRNKSNPVLLATQSTPTNFTHNTWLSNDRKTLFTTDENSGSYLGAFDISDPLNIQEISRSQTAPGSGAIIHNTHVLNDFAITSWYKEGVVITDVSRPWNPIEVGHYDTYPQGSGNGFNGCWGVYPFLPSGTIVASDIDNGLFVLTPDYVRGCYLEGVVTDSVTGFPLPGATVQLVQANISKLTGTTGAYATGTPTAGTYDVVVSRGGYLTRTYSGISLTNGNLTTLNVPLPPLSSVPVEGMVTDALTGLPVQNATVSLINTDFDLTTNTDPSGGFNYASVVDGSYELISGQWGYQTLCNSVSASGGPFAVALDPGFMDDFSFDFGWTVSGTTPNAWERGEPNGTFDTNNNPVNPEYDATGDCGTQCYVTDNRAGAYNAYDVDNGYSYLTSPTFDLTIYQNPVIELDRWFVNIGGTGTPNDTMIILLTDGTDTVRLATINRNSLGQAAWYHETFTVSNYMTPSNTMRLMVRIEDYTPGHIVEGGIDNFYVSGTLTLGMDASVVRERIVVYPNPSIGCFRLQLPEGVSSVSGQLLDITGRVLAAIHYESGQRIDWPEAVASGFYQLRLQSADGKEWVLPVVRR